MRTASLRELLARVAPGGAGVRAMKASYSASYTDPAKRVSRSASGMLAMAAPGRLRMKGSAAMLPTLFDLLVSDGKASVYLPRDRAVYRGDAAGGGIAEAALLLSVFLGIAREEGDLLPFIEEEPDRYIVHFAGRPGAGPRPGARPALARRIIFDRADLSPVRYQYFDQAGRLSRDILCSRFGAAEGAPSPLPREVTIDAPQEGARLVLRLSDLRVNPALPAAIFSLDTPPGTAVRPIGECLP